MVYLVGETNCRAEECQRNGNRQVLPAKDATAMWQAACRLDNKHRERERGVKGARKQCCHVCVARVACDVSRIRVEAAIGIAVPGRQHVT